MYDILKLEKSEKARKIQYQMGFKINHGFGQPLFELSTFSIGGNCLTLG